MSANPIYLPPAGRAPAPDAQGAMPHAIPTAPHSVVSPKPPKGRAPSQLMESDEFGDWLIGEISLAGAQAKSAIFDKALPASLRLESLGVSKKVLLEFLLLQQAMLNTASAARGG